MASNIEQLIDAFGSSIASPAAATANRGATCRLDPSAPAGPTSTPPFWRCTNRS